MPVLEPFAQQLTAQLGNEADYKVCVNIINGEIAQVFVLGAVGLRQIDADLAHYSPGEGESETDQINDVVELIRELMAATKNAPQGDVATAELGAFVHAAQELETFLDDRGYEGPATI
jgi:hypothetical protein